ncbi:hypothetical protein [Prescottella agglutinans]|uniref:Uncharacterized protein n=1 Tax=Prescottella agglutinans TaxID=1644129 RepID=A0ABT6M7C9_9NOCA|nr:hypothetical protein [Prescottella agglutinans]MDH6280211.1 hypothetical protein [Prescottella agglutinans]
MSRNWVAALGVAGLLGAAACSTTTVAVPATDPAVVRASLLPDESELPPGTVVEPLDGEEQMVLNLKLDAPSTGIGPALVATFAPPECDEQNSYSDEARIRLAENGSAAGALLAGERAYIMLVSETGMNISRVANAHTGSCSTYTVTYDDPAAVARTVRTERLDLPPTLAAADAVIVSEVSHRDNPKWADQEVMLGYAVVRGYTVMVLAHQGKEFRAEFDDVFTRVVEKVRERA